MDDFRVRPLPTPFGPPPAYGAESRRMSLVGPRPETSPEAQLAAIATHGDRAAFAALFDRFAPRIRAYYLRGGCPAAHADELVQDAMLAVWRKAGQFDPGRANAAAWIFAIARNLRIDALRRRQEPTVAVEAPDRASEEPGPDERLYGAQAALILRQALLDLPPEQVEVIRAAYFDDLPHSEIAAALGLPLGTVKSRLRLALQRLRGRLGQLQ